MPTTTYRAEWCSKIVCDPQTGGVEPDLCEYDTADYSLLATAAERACENNCYGSEGFVSVLEWGRDRETNQPAWVTRGRWRCADGEAVEQVA
jgi:hypothetical protein